MTAIAAILLVCSHGDRDVAADVYAAAVQAQVDPVLALSIAAVESGCHGANPLGVMVPVDGHGQVACGRDGRLDAAACTVLGVRSLANRLRGCKDSVTTRREPGSRGTVAPAAQTVPMGVTAGKIEACAARRYHGTRHGNAAKYAAKVLKIARFVRARSKP